MPKTARERQVERALKLEASVAAVQERGMVPEIVSAGVSAALDAAITRAGITGVPSPTLARMSPKTMMALCMEANVLSHDALTYKGIPVQSDASIPDGIVAIAPPRPARPATWALEHFTQQRRPQFSNGGYAVVRGLST